MNIVTSAAVGVIGRRRAANLNGEAVGEILGYRDGLVRVAEEGSTAGAAGLREEALLPGKELVLCVANTSDSSIWMLEGCEGDRQGVVLPVGEDVGSRGDIVCASRLAANIMDVSKMY